MSKTKDEAILKHGFRLIALFPNSPYATPSRPVSLYKRLHRLEAEAHTFAEKCCNEDVGDERIKRKDASIMRRLRAVLGEGGPTVFVNSDPRGYALKIKSEFAVDLDIFKDWGGFGIICPDF